MARTKTTFKSDTKAKAKGKTSVPKGKASKPKAKASGKTSVPKPKISLSHDLEFPNVKYNFTVKDAIKIFNKIRREVDIKYEDKELLAVNKMSMFDGIMMTFTPKQIVDRFYIDDDLSILTDEHHEKVASILTILREYEDQSTIQPIEAAEESPSDEHQTSQNFDELHLRALFWLYDEDRYAYLRIKIAPSAIKAAGMGAYAVDEIPKSAIGLYAGVPRTEEDSNLYYSWVIKSFDPQEGLEDDNETYIYYVDASDLKRSNWTRYVNCGMKNKDNNMEQEQVYDKIFYTTTKKVPAGKEFFIDYGSEYREYNLGMKGKY